VEIRVEDNGTGIPPESLEQIFEPFFTTKGRDTGTGLGLSISQQIVEEHRGRIEVTSELGRGSCFTVRLPAADAVVLG
jgi:signal transduction histidine kinase